MNYTLTTLVLSGVGGILCHNLIKMNKLNREANGNFNLLQYLRIERFSIILSFIVVLVSAYFSQEVKDLAKAGKYLGVGMFAIGFMAQSLLLTLMGKAQKFIENDK